MTSESRHLRGVQINVFDSLRKGRIRDLKNGKKITSIQELIRREIGLYGPPLSWHKMMFLRT